MNPILAYIRISFANWLPFIHIQFAISTIFFAAAAVATAKLLSSLLTNFQFFISFAQFHCDDFNLMCDCDFWSLVLPIWTRLKKIHACTHIQTACSINIQYMMTKSYLFQLLMWMWTSNSHIDLPTTSQFKMNF